MKIKNTETGDVLTLTDLQAVGNAIRLEFSSGEDCIIEYLYPSFTLEESLEDDGYKLMEEER